MWAPLGAVTVPAGSRKQYLGGRTEVAGVAAVTWASESCLHCRQQTPPDKASGSFLAGYVLPKTVRFLELKLMVSSHFPLCKFAEPVSSESPAPESTGVKGLPWQNFVQQSSLGSLKGGG